MKEIPTGGKARFGRFGLKPVLTALSILLAVSLFINTQLCYAISVNGETVGTARDLAAASELVSNAEQQASEILGYDYSLEDQVSVSAWLGSGSSAEAGLSAASFFRRRKTRPQSTKGSKTIKLEYRSA